MRPKKRWSDLSSSDRNNFCLILVQDDDEIFTSQFFNTLLSVNIMFCSWSFSFCIIERFRRIDYDAQCGTTNFDTSHPFHTKYWKLM